MENKSILALDLGMKTGWAIKGEDGTTTSGTRPFKNGRIEGSGMPFLRFEAWLNKLNAIHPVGVLYFEEVRRHLGTDAAHVYGGFMALLMVWAEENKIPYSSVPVGTIKMHITGKGNAGKPAVIEAVEKLGFSPVDDNEADALALLDYAVKVLHEHL